MKVLITGATGTVGAHAVTAVTRAGHEVRVFARSADKVKRVLASMGTTAHEIAIGDVTDEVAVRNAVEGCDAVIHAAGLLTFDRGRTQEMLDTNIEGSRLVLESAYARHLDPIILVSSVSAFFPPDGRLLTPDSEIKSPKDPYARSKAEAERISRAMQERGAPVVSIYPGGVWGPDDPTLGHQITTIFAMVKAGYYLCPPGSVTLIDVRDLAEAMLRALRPGQGPKRYMLSGHRVTFDDKREIFERITGRRFLRVPIPGWMLRLAGRAGDLLGAHTPIDPGAVTSESMTIATSNFDGDDSRALEELDLELRPLEETIADQMRWMQSVGYLTERHLGELAKIP